MKKILFVCVENAGRSQVTEAFFNKYLPAGFRPVSAGTEPTVKVNLIVVQAMKGIGVDIDDTSPKKYFTTNDR
jgi:protein-tyrosine-phosphatase